MADNSILTSVHGRRLGLDKDGGLVSREPLQALSTATGSVINSRGITTLSSAAATYTIDGPPVPGVIKRIATLTSSTLIRGVTRSSTALYFESTDGSTMVKIAMAGRAAAVTLLGLSTSVWMVVTRISTDTTLSGTS